MKTTCFYAALLVFFASNIFTHQNAIAQEIPIGAPYIKSAIIIDEGIELHDDEKYKEALEKYNMVYPGDSLYDLAKYEKCLTYYALDSFQTCINLANEIIARKSYQYRVDALLLKINSYIELKNYEEVQKICDEAIRNFPYHNIFYIKRGQNYENQQKFQEAYKDYSESIKLNPVYNLSHIYLGRLYAKMDLPSLSLLAYQSFLIINSNTSLTNTAIAELETVCKNQATVNLAFGETFRKNFKAFEEIDLVVKSQAAISDKYKSIIKLTYISNKQLQVILEKLSSDMISDDATANFYVNFYKKTWDLNYFESCVLTGFNSIENKEIQAEVSKKKKKTDVYLEWAKTYLLALRDTKTITENNKTEQYAFEYDGIYVDGYGKKNAENKKTGRWKFFYNNYALSAEGEFKNDLYVGKWIYYYDDGSVKKIINRNEKGELEGEYISYFENGQVYEHFHYKADLLNGTARLYRANGSKKIEGEFEEDKIKGDKRYYDEYNNLEESQPFENGKISGMLKTYNQEGKVIGEILYTNNEPNGIAKYYHANGKISSTGNFIMNKMDGTWKSYHENGELKSEVVYAKGLMIGTAKYYTETGKLEIEEKYSNGVLDGQTKINDMNGKALADILYKKGDLISYKYFDTLGNTLSSGTTSNKNLTLIRYNDYRQKVSEGKLVNSKKEGTWTFYYTNGVVESTVEYKDNEKNGTETFYHYNGKKKNEKNYINGKMDGYYRAWYRSGIPEAEGYMVEDEQVGQWIFYHENGKVDNISFYNADKIDGPASIFAIDGKHIGTTHFYAGIIKGIEEYDSTHKKINEQYIQSGTGKLYYKHPNGKDYKKFNYKYGNLDSTITICDYKNFTHTTENYKNGKLNGEALYYYVLNNTKSSEGSYKNGEKDGTWKYYYLDGKLLTTENHTKGNLNGKYEIYNEAGFLERSMNYKDDERQGEYLLYTSEKDLAVKLFYINGVLTQYTYLDENNKFVPYIPIQNETGHILAYYPNKQKSVDYKLLNGFIEGEYLVYFRDGKLMNKEFYANTLKEGKEYNYYPNGKLASESEHINGKTHGLYKTYNMNGTLKIQANYSYDYLNGESILYDDNGKEIKRIKFRNGVAYE